MVREAHQWRERYRASVPILSFNRDSRHGCDVCGERIRSCGRSSLSLHLEIIGVGNVLRIGICVGSGSRKRRGCPAKVSIFSFRAGVVVSCDCHYYFVKWP